MVWRHFATQLERADTMEADRPKLGAPSLYAVVRYNQISPRNEFTRSST